MLKATPRLLLTIVRTKIYIRVMESPDICPPAAVRGMKKLDRAAFTKSATIPVLSFVPTSVNLNRVLTLLKKLLLKMENMKPVQGDEKVKRILLHPAAVDSWEKLPVAELEALGIDSDKLRMETIEIKYENWRSNDILRAVLPEDQEGATSFSRIGHIIHLNLKEHLMEYRHLIAEVLFDQFARTGLKTVVNKVNEINNTYRNFEMELLIGEPDYRVMVKENGARFWFDFSTVYWNPRLSAEHARIVEMLQQGDVLYDVFAGVGPFTVPAARKGIRVLANDLNPESYRWLKENVLRNKVKDRVQSFNKDGREFILTDVREDLPRAMAAEGQIHIVMNLPAMAVEFLDAFRGVLPGVDEVKKPPIVHVYCFAKGDDKTQIAIELVEKNLGRKLDAKRLIQVAFVRNVAPNKDMMRVDFWLDNEILCDVDRKRALSDDGATLNQKKVVMGKKNKAKQAQKSTKGPIKGPITTKQTNKKLKNVFAVPTEIGKRINRKAKKVQTTLKRLSVPERRDKVDSQLKELHETLVIKKANPPPPKMARPKRPPAPPTNQIEASLESMQV